MKKLRKKIEYELVGKNRKWLYKAGLEIGWKPDNVDSAIDRAIDNILQAIREAMPKEINIDEFYKKHKKNMDIDWGMTEKLIIKKNQAVSDIKEILK